MMEKISAEVTLEVLKILEQQQFSLAWGVLFEEEDIDWFVSVLNPDYAEDGVTKEKYTKILNMLERSRDTNLDRGHYDK